MKLLLYIYLLYNNNIVVTPLAHRADVIFVINYFLFECNFTPKVFMRTKVDK